MPARARRQPVRCHPSRLRARKGEYVAAHRGTNASVSRKRLQRSLHGVSFAASLLGCELHPFAAHAPTAPTERPAVGLLLQPPAAAAAIRSVSVKPPSSSGTADAVEAHGVDPLAAAHLEPVSAVEGRRAAVCLAGQPPFLCRLGRRGVADAADSSRSDRIRRRKGPAAGSAAMRSTTGWTADCMSERPAALGSTNSEPARRTGSPPRRRPPGWRRRARPEEPLLAASTRAVPLAQGRQPLEERRAREDDERPRPEGDPRA